MDGLELVSSQVERSAGDADAIPDVVAALHRFAGGVYAALPASGNLVLSPYSIVVALGMALAGAAGTTAEEMRAVLGADDRFHAGLNALTAHVAGLAGSQDRADGSAAEIALDAANQLFGQRGIGCQQPFLDQLAEHYGVGLRTVDFETAADEARVLINSWVEEQTHDRIQDLVPVGVLDALTRLVLVNAIYLKAPWETPFGKHQTVPGPFHRADGTTVDAAIMAGAPARTLASGDGWRAACLPYAGNRLAMTVVLPDEGRHAEVESLVAAGGLEAVLTAAEPTRLDVHLPRWTSRSSMALAEVLAGSGMPTAFDQAAADFGPMTTEDLGLFLGAVVHQGFVAVDEDGTEAAAATAVVMQARGAPMPAEPFHVDRPFLYVVHDIEHGTPLFLGRVLDPTAE